jgi:hypothetical protein
VHGARFQKIEKNQKISGDGGKHTFSRKHAGMVKFELKKNQTRGDEKKHLRSSFLCFTVGFTSVPFG